MNSQTKRPVTNPERRYLEGRFRSIDGLNAFYFSIFEPVEGHPAPFECRVTLVDESTGKIM
jgi:hypothetical protein